MKTRSIFIFVALILFYPSPAKAGDRMKLQELQTSFDTIRENCYVWIGETKKEVVRTVALYGETASTEQLLRIKEIYDDMNNWKGTRRQQCEGKSWEKIKEVEDLYNRYFENTENFSPLGGWTSLSGWLAGPYNNLKFGLEDLMKDRPESYLRRMEDFDKNYAGASVKIKEIQARIAKEKRSLQTSPVKQ